MFPLIRLLREADGLGEDHVHLRVELEDLADGGLVVHAEGDGAEALRSGIQVHVLSGLQQNS